MRRPVRLSWALAVVLVGAALSLALNQDAGEHRPPSLDLVHAGDGTAVGTPERLADNLWVVHGGGGATAVFLTARGVIVVDPKFASSWAALERQIRTLTDAPITHAIVTHWHSDHAEAVVHLPSSVQIVAQRQTLRRMIFYRYLPDGFDTTPRAVTYDDRLELFAGDDAITVLTAGPSHTDGDAVVYFHAARTAHMGDVVPGKHFPIISLEGGGDGRRYPETVRATLAALPDAATVITGHGPVLRRPDVETFASLLELSRAHVATEMAMFRDKAAIFRALRLPARFSDYDTSRQFDTLDEFDRSLRPRWQRVF